MQSKVCNRCPILSRCLLTYGSKACHAAAKEVGFVVKMWYNKQNYAQ